MSADSNNVPDDQELYELVRRFDEALARGADTESIETDDSTLSGAAAEELSGLQACVELLEGVRRERSSRISLTGSIQRLVASLGPTELPQQIGRFELRGEIGRGGFGVVLRAHDTKLARDVAIKIPRPEALVSDDLRERFLREARAAGAVDHPNIVSIYEVGEEGPISYIAAAYIPGPTLAAWFSGRKGPLDFEQASRLILVLAQALDHAHSRGVVHRDIKPGNILLQPNSDNSQSKRLSDYTPKIADFGLAKLRESTEVATCTGAMLGTPAYMAPEQAAGKTSEIGPVTDVYSLGAILFELLTGQPPLRGESDIDTLRRIVSDEPPLVRIARPRVPRDLEAICLKCLEKRPSQRYPSAAALASDLQSFLEGKTTQARPIGTTRRVYRWARHRPTVAALLLFSLLTLSLLVVGGWTYNARLSGALQVAEAERNRAESETLVSRQLLYSAEVRLAYDAWHSFNRKRTIELLERQIPAPGQVDLREFAWHWLWGESHAEVRTFEGHTADVFAVEFSPDGQTLATASKDGTARIWDVASGNVLHTLDGHSSEVTCVAFSPDGTRLATGSEDLQIILWDPATGEALHTLTGHDDHVLTVAFSPDGRQLASGGRDKQVRLWDLSTHQQVQSPEPNTSVVRCIRYSPDGQTLAACDEDGTIHLWMTADWQHRAPLRNSDGPLFAIDFQDDSKHLVSAGRDSTLYCWDLESNTCAPHPESKNHESWIRDSKLSPDGTLVANANQNGFTVLWRMDSEENDGPIQVSTIQGHEGRVWNVAWSPDGKHLATAGADNVIRLWDVEKQLGISPYSPSSGWVWDLAFTGDTTKFVTAHQGGDLCTWDAATHGLQATCKSIRAGDRTVLSVHPTLNLAAMSAWSIKSVQLVDLSTGKVVLQKGTFPGSVNDIEFNDTKSMVAVATAVRTVHVLDLPGGEERYVLQDDQPVNWVAFSPDGTKLLTCSRELRLWDADSGELLWGRRQYEANPRNAIFSPNGQVIAAAIGNRIIALIDPTTGEIIGELQSTAGRANVMVFSPDGRTLAIGTQEPGLVALWDIRTRQELCVMESSLKHISSLTFSPDGNRLLAAGHGFENQPPPYGIGQIIEWAVWPRASDSR